MRHNRSIELLPDSGTQFDYETVGALREWYKLLGVECCHAPKTKIDVAVISQAKRREAKFHGFSRKAPPIKSPPFPKSEKAAKRLPKPELPRRPLYQENRS